MNILLVVDVVNILLAVNSGIKNIKIYNINFCNFIESRKYKSVIISDVEELNK